MEMMNNQNINKIMTYLVGFMQIICVKIIKIIKGKGQNSHTNYVSISKEKSYDVIHTKYEEKRKKILTIGINEIYC